jgi:putative Mg2+ transporter-C (MgtC) family protein
MRSSTRRGTPRINRVNPFRQAARKAPDGGVRIRSGPPDRALFAGWVVEAGALLMSPIHQIVELLRNELGVVLSSTLARLVLAAILGGIIGLERQLRHKPAGLRTNMFICFGAAMFTVLSNQLASSLGGDHTRIAAQIIPGIGFIGAGSILHARASVTGLTTAATLFVVASVGMAAGGGLYLTAIFATGLILIALVVLGGMEHAFSLKSLITTYEVTGRNVDGMLREVNRLLDAEQLTMHSVHITSADPDFRMVFAVDCEHEQQSVFSIRLHESNAFGSVRALGVTEHE